MLWLLYLPSFILVFLVWLIPQYLEHRRLRKLAGLLPGLKVTGVLGDVRLLLMQNLDLRTVTSAAILSVPVLYKNQGLTCFRILHKFYVALFKADYVEALLSSNTNITKNQEYELLHPWLGNGLITGNGSQWRKHRKILTPAFHFRILEEFIPIVNEQADILVEKLQEHTNEPWVDINAFLTRCTMDIICETSMGIQLGCQSHQEPEYVKALKVVQETFLLRSFLPWYRPKLIFYALPAGREYLRCLGKVQSFTRQVVRQRKDEILQCGWKMTDESSSDSDVEFRRPKSRLAFLDLLLHYHIHDQTLTESEVQDEVNTFMFAGHDTTTQAMTWTLYLLGLHQDIQAKVHQEIDNIFGNNKRRFVNVDDLKTMKYLECVIKESQRLYPPVPLFGRKLTEDMVVEGRRIPKGMTAIVDAIMLHRDERIFPEPHRFIPERFLPENGKSRHPYAFVPFSAGPRNCIGQRFAMNEEKIILSTVLRHFKAESLDPQDKLLLDANVVLKSCSPIRIKLSPRKS